MKTVSNHLQIVTIIIVFQHRQTVRAIALNLQPTALRTALSHLQTAKKTAFHHPQIARKVIVFQHLQTVTKTALNRRAIAMRSVLNRRQNVRRSVSKDQMTIVNHHHHLDRSHRLRKPVVILITDQKSISESRVIFHKVELSDDHLQSKSLPMSMTYRAQLPMLSSLGLARLVAGSCKR